MDATLVSFVSACTALVASVVGPVVTIAVSKRQINADVISANRQKWIETLRDTMAEIISLMVALRVVKQEWKGPWNRGRDAIAADRSLITKLERIILVSWKIRLLINPAEADQAELVRRIEACFNRLEVDDVDDEEATRADIEEITRLSQTILRAAWARVKTGT